MPHETGIHECGDKMRRLPRRYSPSTIRCELRELSQRERLASLTSADSRTSKPVSIDWGTRDSRLRILSQRRRDGAISRIIDAVLQLPRQGLSTIEESEPRSGQIFNHMPAMSRHGHVAQCQIRSRGLWIPAHERTRCTAAPMRRLPCEQQLQPDQQQLCLMPPQRFSVHGQPQPREEWISADL